ncbi:hypothetical protein GOODEAATRI_030644 [Goodea atripinnis]|uniref:BHLH domain-containing protein n=1 Tax=Goodea atripinnis TaxID=208336 RepID=A0ABV0PIH5_9TELE
MFEFMKKQKISFPSSTSTVDFMRSCRLKVLPPQSLNMIKIYVLTSAELSCMMSHRSNRTRTVLQQEQRKSSKHDLKVSELLQKVFPMLTKGDAGEEETLSLLSLYFTVRKKEIKNI